MKYAIYSIIPFLFNKNDRENSRIPKVTKTIEDLLQVKVKFYFFSCKTFCILKVW